MVSYLVVETNVYPPHVLFIGLLTYYHSIAIFHIEFQTLEDYLYPVDVVTCLCLGYHQRHCLHTLHMIVFESYHLEDYFDSAKVPSIHFYYKLSFLAKSYHLIHKVFAQFGCPWLLEVWLDNIMTITW